MNENVFQESEEITIETDTFSTNAIEEYAKPKPCPPGHYKSMEAGGNGHYPGDKCGCGDGVGTTVPIGNIIFPLIITAFIIIILTRFKPKH